MSFGATVLLILHNSNIKLREALWRFLLWCRCSLAPPLPAPFGRWWASAALPKATTHQLPHQYLITFLWETHHASICTSKQRGRSIVPWSIQVKVQGHIANSCCFLTLQLAEAWWPRPPAVACQSLHPDTATYTHTQTHTLQFQPQRVQPPSAGWRACCSLANSGRRSSLVSLLTSSRAAN